MSEDLAILSIGGDRFDVVERLGGGGGGEVFLVRDREHGGDVALKLLHKRDATALYRFKHEFRALADLSHRNLVQYYELVAQEDQWFLIMEYVDGVDVLTYVRKGLETQEPTGEESVDGVPVKASQGQDSGGYQWPDEEDTAVTQTGSHLPLRKSVRTAKQFERLRDVMVQLVSGVHALHEAGHLHRDIKPTNLLVQRDNRLVLLDFGVVTELAHLEGRTGDDLVVGTPAYMAPEQSAGGALSRGSDWYSVGVVLYEALTGGRPFGGSVRHTLEARARFDPPPPSTFAPGTPSDLDELCMALLRRDPSQRPDGVEICEWLGVSLESSRAAGKSAAASDMLVGREAHMAALSDAFDEACHGRSHAVLVHGVAGMGKTALIKQFLREIGQSRRAIVLEGRCYEHESMPYKALDSIVDALSKHLLSLPRLEVEALLPDDVGALAHLFPVLRRVEAVVGRDRDVQIRNVVELRRRGIEALRELVDRLARSRPVVLYIDDLQWGDTDSAALIKELLRPPQTPGMLFLASYRSEDATTSPFLRALLPLSSVPIEIGLQPLTQSESLAMTDRLLGGVSAVLPTIGRSIARESAGNPFFLHELVRYVQAESFNDMSIGTITLEEVIRVRVRELPEGARRLLDVSAVAGHPVALETARRATELPGGDLDSALHLLRARNLVRTRGGDERESGAVEPYHDRIREVVVSLLRSRALSDVHRRLAMALSAEENPDPEALADHFEGAGQRERAAAYCVLAAVQARRTLATGRAAALYRRALSLCDHTASERATLKAALGAALGDGGAGVEAADMYREAAVDAGELEALGYLRLAGEHLMRVGHVDDGMETLDTVNRELGLRVPSSRIGSIVSLLWRRARLRLGGIRYKRKDEAAIPPIELARLDACWSASVGLAMVDTIQGLDVQTRHLLLALRAGEPRRLARALAVECGFVSTGGVSGRKRFMALMNEAKRLAEGIEAPELRGWILGVEGLGAYQCGEFKRGRELCAKAADVFRSHATTVFFEQSSASLWVVWALYYLGEIAEVAERAPALLRDAEERGDLYSATNFSTGLCCLAWLARDEPVEILAASNSAINRWSHRDYHLQHYWHMAGVLQIGLYIGDAEALWKSREKHWPAFKASQMKRLELVTQEARVMHAAVALMCAGTVGDEREMLAIARREARDLRRTKLPYATAWAGLIDAALLSREGKQAEAVTQLRAAKSAATELDMQAHAFAAQWRLGELVSGDEGAALVAEARDFFVNQGVVCPEKLVRVFAPAVLTDRPKP